MKETVQFIVKTWIFLPELLPIGERDWSPEVAASEDLDNLLLMPEPLGRPLFLWPLIEDILEGVPLEPGVTHNPEDDPCEVWPKY